MKTLNKDEKNQVVSDGKTWFSWTNDGPNADVNSLLVLLDWLSTPGNYNRFTGGVGQKGETKLTVAVEIQNKIQKAGIVVNRSTDSIIHKVKELVTSYKEAHRIRNQTGQSMDNVYAACKHFDILDPILGSRPSVKPLLTNKDIVNGKIILDVTNANNNATSPSSSVQSKSTSELLNCANVTSTRTSVSASASAKKSYSTSDKKKKDSNVAKGKVNGVRDSEKVIFFC